MFFRNLIIGLLLFSITGSSMGMELYKHYCPISKESKYVLETKKCCGAPVEEEDCCHTSKEFKKTDLTDTYKQTIKLFRPLAVLKNMELFSITADIFSPQIFNNKAAYPSAPDPPGRYISILNCAFLI